MDMKQKKLSVQTIAVILCLIILLFFMVSIFVRTFTRQVLVKKYEMDNAFTRTVFFDNTNLLIPDRKEYPIDWQAKYPFDTSEIEPSKKLTPVSRYQFMIDGIKNDLTIYSRELLLMRPTWFNCALSYKKILNWSLFSNYNQPDAVFKLNNGYLTYVQPALSQEEIIEISNSVANFVHFLKAKEIPFLYVNAGSKVYQKTKGDTVPFYAIENTNENGDALIKALSKAGINTLDLRKEMELAGLDHYQSYYRTDHHWKTSTGLWAAGILAQYLNDHYSYEFDPKYFDITNYKVEFFLDSFLGGQSRDFPTAPEDFEFITPLFPTNFSIEIPTSGINLSGNFEDVLMNFDVFNYLSKRNYPPLYDSWTWRNDALGHITNFAPDHNINKKILMIQDSFSWCLTPYLATDIAKIDMIYSPSFNGSLYEYVDQEKPDLVILIACERNISPIDYSTHSSFFYLR